MVSFIQQINEELLPRTQITGSTEPSSGGGGLRLKMWIQNVQGHSNNKGCFFLVPSNISCIAKGNMLLPLVFGCVLAWKCNWFCLFCSKLQFRAYVSAIMFRQTCSPTWPARRNTTSVCSENRQLT